MSRTVSTGTLKYPDDETFFTFNSSCLQNLGEIGNGNFGSVYKMQHVETGKVIAVKKVQCNNMDQKAQIGLLQTHDELVKAENNPNVAKFYGGIFNEVGFVWSCWICMELMDISLDHLHERVYNVKGGKFNENVVGHITVCTVDALDYLKKELKIIHRDVKLSNILVDRHGSHGMIAKFKISDYGISQEIKEYTTCSVGFASYSSPDHNSEKMNDSRADVWSLGIILYEIATGRFPYPQWNSVFEAMAAIVSGDAPMLSPETEGHSYSMPLVKFINTCLMKDIRHRPNYTMLKTFPFYIMYAEGGNEVEKAKEFLGVEAMDARAHLIDNT